MVHGFGEAVEATFDSTIMLYTTSFSETIMLKVYFSKNVP